MDSDIMTIREVTEYLKLTEKAANRHAVDGKIPGFKVEAALWCGLEEAPGPDTVTGSKPWHGVRALVEHSTFSEVRR